MEFTKSLETTLHRALESASVRKHEYATIEHLLYALTEDDHARDSLISCGANIEELSETIKTYLDTELDSLAVENRTDPSPTSGFQRIVQRAILHVQSSGKAEVNGINVLVAIFSERDSYAVYFLQQQDISRLDVVNYLSNNPQRNADETRPASNKGRIEAAGRDTEIAPQNQQSSKSSSENKLATDQLGSIEKLKSLQHDLTAFSDAVSTTPVLSTPKIAEKIVEFLSELIIKEAVNLNNFTTQTPFLTIGIYGPWGSGKSTLLSSISRTLVSDGAIVIPINTWKWDGKRDISEFVNEQLLDGLSRNSSFKWIARSLIFLLFIRRNFKRIVIFSILSCLSILAHSFIDLDQIRTSPQVVALKSAWTALGAGLVAIIAKPLFAIFEKIILKARAPNESGETLTTSYKYLLLTKSISKSKKKTTFFMFDDLDRCEPDRVVTFMRSIHRLTTSGSISIIGCDDRIVASSIYSEFQKIADISGEGPEFGNRFLEKMVQVHFRMPDVSEADLAALGMIQSDTSTNGNGKELVGQVDASLIDSFDYTIKPNPLKDLGESEESVDFISLQNICAEVLGAIVELYRLPIRRIKFLSNLMKLYCMIFPPSNELEAYRLVSFLGMNHVDKNWLVEFYFGRKKSAHSTANATYENRIFKYLGNDRDAVLPLYALCGLDDMACHSAHKPPSATLRKKTSPQRKTKIKQTSNSLQDQTITQK